MIARLRSLMSSALRGAIEAAERILGRDGTDTLATLYLRGAQAAHGAHGPDFGIPRVIPVRIALELRDDALATAERNRERLIAAITANESEVAQALAFARITSTVTTWAGQDDHARRIQELAQLEWKEWVRVWPRDTHRDHHDAMEGTTIPVDEKFVIPFGPNAGARVYGPRAWDDLPSVGEWINCGHALRFHEVATREMTRI